MDAWHYLLCSFQMSTLIIEEEMGPENFKDTCLLDTAKEERIVYTKPQSTEVLNHTLMRGRVARRDNSDVQSSIIGLPVLLCPTNQSVFNVLHSVDSPKKGRQRPLTHRFGCMRNLMLMEVVQIALLHDLFRFIPGDNSIKIECNPKIVTLSGGRRLAHHLACGETLRDGFLHIISTIGEEKRHG